MFCSAVFSCETPSAAPIWKWFSAFSGERCALRSSTGRRSAS
jgi:hypothetical protein